MSAVDPDQEAEEREFIRVYGPWVQHTPASAAALFDGFAAPWWISGGWAIEAFSGVSREHDDVDVTIFRRDIGALRAHFAGRFDLWVAGSGQLRPLNDRWPDVPRWMGQVWMREHALAPWQLDVQLNAGTHRRWIFKRDNTVTRPFDEATWIAGDGLRYLRPELVLAHKVALGRPKDDVDLTAVLPLLDDSALAWLRSYVQKAAPDHPWCRRLDAGRRQRRLV
jgi:hypothetical protein